MILPTHCDKKDEFSVKEFQQRLIWSKPGHTVIKKMNFRSGAGMDITTISRKMKEQYGQKVYRLSLSSGCTCPNRDGTVGTGGCTFCSEGGSGDFAARFFPDEESGDFAAEIPSAHRFGHAAADFHSDRRWASQLSETRIASLLDHQIEEAKQKISGKLSDKIPENERIYIAYFQSFSNTYARSPEELKRLEMLYSAAISRPDIAVLDLATRPDCLGREVLEMLAKVQSCAPEKPIWIELGLQTIHERTAEAFHRGYALSAFEEAYGKLKHAGYEVIVHVILGLPGENREEMLETVRYLAGLEPRLDGIKLSLLHVLKGTALAAQYEKDPFPLPDMEAYCDLVVDALKCLPEDVVIHRMTGDGPKKLLIAPLWTGDKKRVLNCLNRKIREAER